MQPIVFQALADAARSGEPVVLGIITGVKGSSPQKLGAKALFYGDGRIQGTLGGGCLEAEIQQRAIQALRTGQAATFDLLLDHDFGWDDGLICGGKVFGLILPNAQEAGEKFWTELAERKAAQSWGVRKDFSIGGSPGVTMGKPLKRLEGPGCRANTQLKLGVNKRQHPSPLRPAATKKDWLYEEMVTPPCALWIAGAGHIAQAVAPLALPLEFEVTVFDDRPALACTQFFPKATQFRVGYWDQLLAEALPPRPTFGLIVTRGHQHDALVLRHWIRRPFAFLGMIGSSRKKRLIFSQFAEEKLATEEQLAKVACPVGLDICAVSPHEIAVSILAQYVQKRAELLHPQLLERRRQASATAA